jgi:hypothetical protein
VPRSPQDSWSRGLTTMVRGTSVAVGRSSWRALSAARAPMALGCWMVLFMACPGCDGSSGSPAPIGCATDGDCIGELVCDAASGQCVQPSGAGGAAGQGGAGGGGGGVSRDDNVAAGAPCKVIPQGGCPTDHTCLVSNPAGATSCYSAGAVPLGGACASINDCAPGLICYGQCVRLCAQLDDCPSAPYGECIPFTVGADDKPLPGMGGCSPHCNPADPANKAGDPGFEPCAAGRTCYFPAKAPQGATSCFQAGTGGPGAACEKVGDCAAGHTCLVATAGAAKGACTPLCLKKGAGCKSGESCESFGTKQYVGTKSGLVEVGFCY